MEDQKVLINIPPDYKGEPINVNWREGVAGKTIDEAQPKKVSRNGTITAAEEYVTRNYAKQLEASELQKGIVTFSYDPKKLFISFDEFPAHPIDGAVISGRVEINPEVLAWRVNTKNTFDENEVIALIRSQAHNFASKDECKKLIKTLQNFKATFTTEREKADNRKGNVIDAIIETLSIKKGEMPEALNLSIPVFKGGIKMPLVLEIELDRQGSDVVYSFYSLELESVIRETAKDSIEQSVAKLRPAFVCIEEA